MVENLTYVQMRESGYINHYESVMLAEAKAKTVTSNLLQLTVLAKVVCPELLQGTKRKGSLK